MTLLEWGRKNNKQDLVALYDDSLNEKPSSEVPFSSGKRCWCKCPDCEKIWESCPNKLITLTEKKYNYFRKTHSMTYCIACGGKRPSHFYNLEVCFPEICNYYDYENNKTKPNEYTPKSRKRIKIKCSNPSCDYGKEVVIQDFVESINVYKCPKCQNGINRGVSMWHNLQTVAPEIAKEYDVRLNDGETAELVSPTCREKRWFTCLVCNHSYKARVSNRVYLKRGCPQCNKQNTTSFMEQAFFYYIKKCINTAENRIFDENINLEIDILLADRLLAIEYSSHYYHAKINPKRRVADNKKLMELTKYYKVISLQEYEPEFTDEMIEYIVLPIFEHNRNSYQIYNNVIRDLLLRLAPDHNNYPNINIERDILQILQQYMKNIVKGNLEEIYPEYKKSWDNEKNGDLRPNMFKASNSFVKFNWRCLNCKKNFQQTIHNRIKIPHDKCKHCNDSKRSKTYTHELMSECIRKIKPFWYAEMNNIKLEDLNPCSEVTIILRLYDDRCVPVKCYNLFEYIKNNPDHLLETYLEKKYSTRHR